jgi:hypothetical protein
MRRSTIIIWAALSTGLLLAGGLALLLFLPPYPASRSLVDYLARDHHMQRFSAQFYASARLPALILGGLAALAGVASMVFARRAQTFLSMMGTTFKNTALRLAGDPSSPAPCSTTNRTHSSPSPRRP